MVQTGVRVINLEHVERQIGKIPDEFFSAVTLTELGLYFIFNIKQRTAKGVDVNNNAFKPYSAKYAIFREKAGFSSSPVDLFRSGSMLGALQAEPLVSEKAVKLFFTNTTDKEGVSNPLKAAGLNKDRRFFAVSDEDVRGALKIIKKRFVKSLRG